MSYGPAGIKMPTTYMSTEYEKPSKIVVRMDGAIAVERMNEKNVERTAENLKLSSEAAKG